MTVLEQTVRDGPSVDVSFESRGDVGQDAQLWATGGEGFRTKDASNKADGVNFCFTPVALVSVVHITQQLTHSLEPSISPYRPTDPRTYAQVGHPKRQPSPHSCTRGIHLFSQVLLFAADAAKTAGSVPYGQNSRSQTKSWPRGCLLSCTAGLVRAAQFCFCFWTSLTCSAFLFCCKADKALALWNTVCRAKKAGPCDPFGLTDESMTGTCSCDVWAPPLEERALRT